MKINLSSITCPLISMLSSASLLAGSPELLKDIYPGFGSGGSTPTELTVAGDHLYFVSSGSLRRISAATGEVAVITEDAAGDINKIAAAGSRIYYVVSGASGGSSQELYTSDGTPTGTLSKQTFSAFNGSGYVDGTPHRLAGLGSSAYFIVDYPDNNTSSRLWRADGVSGQIWPIDQVSLGTTSSAVFASTVAGGTLYFSAHESYGCTLFRTDGTGPGTSRVKAIPIANGSGSLAAQTLVTLGNTVFFHAKDTVNGDELWKSDGTDAGTMIVADIRPGTAGSMSSLPSAAAFGSHVYFAANNGVNGTELWRTDGTPGGTSMVKDINPGTGSSSPSAFMTAGSLLYFSATTATNGRELWRSDGTEAGTVMIAEIAAGTASGIGSSPAMAVYGDRLYFSANNVTHGEELWQSDGTPAGTQMVADLRAGSASSSPASLVEFDGKLHFTADNGLIGRELWKIDGTSAPVATDLAGENSGNPVTHVSLGEIILFNGTDQDGEELWKTDGSASGTLKIKDIAPGAQSSSPEFFHVLGSKALFSAYTPTHGTELWVTDGTEAGTTILADMVPGSGSSNPVIVATLGQQLVVRSTAGIWRTDGTPVGTYQIGASSLSTSLTKRTVVGLDLYFAASDSTHGEELWKTDGTAAGTVLVKDIRTGTSSSFPDLFTAHGGLLYFRAADSAGNTELWKSDGTPSGTVMVKDIWAGSTGSSPTNFHVVNGKLIFLAGTAAAGREMWTTDGTADGTVMVLDMNPGTSNSGIGTFFNFNGKAYFWANATAHGAEYWMTDGTTAGTQLLKDIRAGSAGSEPGFLSVQQDAFYFRADDGIHGNELWKSDGTEAGTILVKDIIPGNTTSSSSEPLFWADGYLYFRVYWLGVYEMWRTDGTEAGTVPIIDLESNAVMTSAGGYSLSGRYFTRHSVARGREAWVIDPHAPYARPITDINPGPGDSNAFGPRLWPDGSFGFIAFAPGIGREWFTADSSFPFMPYATTRAASAVGTTTAALEGLVLPSGRSTTAEFNYGSTPEFGNSVSIALSPTDGTVPQTVSHTLTGLIPGTTYFYQLSATNVAGTDFGGIRSFRTVASNASLATLSAGGAVLTPAFQPGILEYEVNLPVATSSVAIWAETLDPGATVSVAGSTFQTRIRSTLVTTNPGTTHVSVEVLAQDGVSSQTYSLTITRPSAPEITVSGGGTQIVDGDSSPSTTDRTEHGPVELGSSGLFLFTVSNVGTEPLTIQAPVISGTHADDFTVISSPGPTMAPGVSSLLLVQFTPSALGARNAAISFASNDGDENPFNFSLRGTGIVPQVPEIVVEHPAGTVLGTNPAAIDFGSTAVFATGATREIIIRNTGTSTLQDIYTGISGLAEDDFILNASTLGTSLAPGGMATITVTFSPKKGGRRDAVLEITSNDTDENPFLINLSGVGVKSYDFTYSINGTTVDANGTVVLTFGGVANAPLSLPEAGSLAIPQFQTYNFINTCAFGNYPYSFNSNRATTVNGIARTGSLNQPVSFTLCAGSLSIGASQPVTWTLDAGGGDMKSLSLVIGAGAGGWMPGTFTLAEVNDPPVAVITDPPAAIPLNTFLTLDGSASYDLDGSGHIAAWDWDLDNDGTYERSGPIIEVPGEQLPATWVVNTTAQIRLRVTDNSGSTNVQLITPSILPEPVPAFQLLAPTDVGETRATLNAMINPNGYASWAYIDWGTSSNYGATLFLNLDPSDGTDPQSVSGVLEDLIASTTYYYRLAVGNDYGAFYSEEASFTTPSPVGLIFADPNLESALRIALAIPSGPITAANMLTLTNLNLANLGISDLSGLETAANLRILDIRGNPFADAAATWAILDQLSLYCLFTDLPRPGGNPPGLLTQTVTTTTGGTIYISVDPNNLPTLDISGLGIDTTDPANLDALDSFINAGVVLETGVTNLPPAPIGIAIVTNQATGGTSLDGSASRDIDGSVVAWAWTWAGGSASGSNPNASFPVGATIVTLTVSDNDGAQGSTSFEVTVQGAPEISIEHPVNTELVDASSTVTFPSTVIGSAGEPLGFTIRNSGNVALQDIAIAVQPSGSEFALDLTGTAAALAAGGSTTFNVVFSPSETGARTASLVVQSNDPDEDTTTIGLAGVGLPPPAPQEYLWTNFSGQAGGVGNADGSGSFARFANPAGIVAGENGSLFVADSLNHVIRKITADGNVTTFAGTSQVMGSTDGVGSAASFSGPAGIAVVPGNSTLLVADTNNHTIRMISPTGDVTTVAGQAGSSGNLNGSGPNARFFAPRGVAADQFSNIYVADTLNHTIRKISYDGQVSLFAGTPGQTGSVDGTGAAARFNSPRGIAVDPAGNVYVADFGNRTIRKINPVGEVTTSAGQAGQSGTTDGNGPGARFNLPSGIVVDSNWNLLVADTSNHAIRRIDPLRNVTTLAGLAGNIGSVDAAGSAARFNQPQGICVDGNGLVHVADTGSSTIRRITSPAEVSTLAGTSPQSGNAGGDLAAARYNQPTDGAYDAQGNLYIADTSNHQIRKILPDGSVTVFAGDGLSGLVNGSGTAARFNQPAEIVLDSQGNLLVSDKGNHRIRKITPAGEVTTYAGISSGSTDGAALSARFNGPHGLAIDSLGNLFIVDFFNHTIRKLDTNGNVTTFAGTAGQTGATDATGAAARFNRPAGVAIDAADNLYVTDTINHTIRKITPAGVVTTLAGSAGARGAADGSGIAATFWTPQAIAWHPDGHLIAADLMGHTIRRIDTTGEVLTIGGLGASGTSFDGYGDEARFSRPAGIVIRPDQSLLVMDSYNNRLVTGTPPVSDGVEFGDPLLEAAIRSALSKPTGTITAADMLTLTNLNLSGLGLTSLSGLETAANLRILNIRGNAFTDPAALWAVLDQLTLYCLYVDVPRPGANPPGLLTQTVTDTSGGTFFITVDANNLPTLDVSGLDIDIADPANQSALQTFSNAGINVIGLPNLPPLAAASTTVLDLAARSVRLDGGNSSDPDGSIVSWNWTWSGGSATGSSPTVTLPAGTTIITLNVTDDDGASAGTTVSVTLDPGLSTAFSNAGLTGSDALPDAQPFNDGVPNLLKYAFNMNLAGPDTSKLPPGTGTSGLPAITTPEDAPPGTLRFEFLRRKGSGLAYTPQKSTTLGGTGWAPVAATPVIESIDDQWERVVYTEAPDPTPAPTCFGRVEVAIPQN